MQPTKIFGYTLLGVLATILSVALMLRYADRMTALMITSHPFVAGAGTQQALPPDVLAMADLVNTHGIQAFALSKVLSTHPAPTQRFIEFLYPARAIPAAPFVFAHTLESMPENCRRIDSKGGIVLYDCQNS